jgi:hypothetical protein
MLSSAADGSSEPRWPVTCGRGCQTAMDSRHKIAGMTTLRFARHAETLGASSSAGFKAAGSRYVDEARAHV